MKALIPYVQDEGELAYLERFGQVVEMIPVVRMGGLTPAYYATEDEPDGFLVPVPDEIMGEDT